MFVNMGLSFPVMGILYFLYNINRYMNMAYLVVTSRSPVSHEKVNGKHIARENIGGVVTAMRRIMQSEGGTWVCWGDGRLDGEYQHEDLGAYSIERVLLSKYEKIGFYDDFSNGTLWPLFHYFRERIKFTLSGFNIYYDVNRKFANAIMQNLREGMTIWIHDYQLSLVPGILREAGVKNRIIFTWHIPWVASEFFSTLPRSEELLASIARSNVITFHNETYAENFISSYRSIIGNSEDIRNKVHSISLGIDTSYYSTNNVKPLGGHSFTGRKVIFSIDRLDYTKGLTKKVLTIERLLRMHPEYSEKFVFLMIVTPSRTGVQEYMMMKRELEMTIGRINGEYGSLNWYPIIYIYRKISQKTLLSYYVSADVALITPLFDGLNLVSKEFINATKKGVLIISRFAGAAADLKEALIVNPNDLEGTSEAIVRAFRMGHDEKMARLNKLKQNVQEYDINWWVKKIKKISEGVPR
ncbi:putative bifunctional trehalose-6-phosphate synthase/HAD hydrolase subfamily IIB [Thermoplasmatales archaeon]|nr:putative bifunctional trehalose-6-phosphate synthase/HAD hydrolase subfamily IIB [Thermoplasmatales archaeon]